MIGHKVTRCDCGYRLRARTESAQVAEVRRHAWEAHGIAFSHEEALAVLLRLALDLGPEAAGNPGTADGETARKEQR